MSTGIDTRFIQEQYAQMSDKELIHFFTHDAQGLTPAALAIAKAEVQKRGLDPRLLTALELQQQTALAAGDDVALYYNLVRHLQCPRCQTSNKPLNATVVSEVMSFIFITQRQKQMVIGCPDCLDSAMHNAQLKTLLLGWWGFPWGIIRSIGAIASNIKFKKQHYEEGPNEVLKSFVHLNIGQLSMRREHKEALQNLIK